MASGRFTALKYFARFMCFFSIFELIVKISRVLAILSCLHSFVIC